MIDASGRLDGVVSLADVLDEIVRDGVDGSAAPPLGRWRPNGDARAATDVAVAQPLAENPANAALEEGPGEAGGLANDEGPRTAAAESKPKAPPKQARFARPARMLWWVLGCAVLVRLLVFPFAENKHADAPMRAMLAEYRSTVPEAARDPRTFFQFGPLPIELIQAFLVFGGDVRLLSRVPSLLAGLALFLPFVALARRLTPGPRVAAAAALALALSPLAVQLSTTAASEPIYLLFWLACLERLHAALTVTAGEGEGDQRALQRRRRAYLLAGCWASLAAVSRYDAWLALPVATAGVAVLGPRDRRALGDLLLFLLTAAALPVAYLVWMWVAGLDPWLFARIISREHAASAAALAAGAGGLHARLHQLSVWALGLAAAMTPAGLLGLPLALRQWRRFTAATRVIVATALAPMLFYLAKGLLFGDFAPLSRFALVPGVLLLPLAVGALSTRFRAPKLELAVVAGATAFTVAVSIAAYGPPGGVRAQAESLAPVTRLEHDARAVASYLAVHRHPSESVFVDTRDYVDIIIAHAARVPLPLVATLWRTRVLSDSLAEGHSRSQATLFAAHDSSWGARPLRDWPAGSVRFGRWRVARLK